MTKAIIRDTKFTCFVDKLMWVALPLNIIISLLNKQFSEALAWVFALLLFIEIWAVKTGKAEYEQEE